MSDRAPFEVLGHTWDPVKKRFFKAVAATKEQNVKVEIVETKVPDLTMLRARGRVGLQPSRQFARESLRALYSRLKEKERISLKTSGYKGQDGITSLCVKRDGSYIIGMRNEDIWSISKGDKTMIERGTNDTAGLVCLIDDTVFAVRSNHLTSLDRIHTWQLGHGDLHSLCVSDELAIAIGKTVIYLTKELKLKRRVKAQSDVMALCPSGIGLRSGLVQPWGIKGEGSVTNLVMVSENEILIAWTSGKLVLFHLVNKQPKMTFQGHVNEYTQGMAFGVQEEYRLLAAAGQDSQLRIWTMEDPLPILAVPFEKTPMALSWTNTTPPALLVAADCELMLFQ